MPRITISEPDKTPQPYRLKTNLELTKIGRGSDNDIVLQTVSASTYHCMIKRVDGGFILEDNNSTNGILMEDTRFKIIDLKDDLTVFIGEDIELHFSLSEEEIEVLNGEDFTPLQRAAFPKEAAATLDSGDEEDDVYDKLHKSESKPANKPANKQNSQSDSESQNSAVKTSAAPLASAKASGGIGVTLLFVVLAVIFLLAGMCVRHAIDHDGSFLFSKQEQGK